VSTLLADAPRLLSMGDAAKRLAQPNAARDMAEAVVGLALRTS
jgi:UDP-N-acetylglucosamine:LPS N-acetylglucosamine transferase